MGVPRKLAVMRSSLAVSCQTSYSFVIWFGPGVKVGGMGVREGVLVRVGRGVIEGEGVGVQVLEGEGVKLGVGEVVGVGVCVGVPVIVLVGRLTSVALAVGAGGVPLKGDSSEQASAAAARNRRKAGNQRWNSLF